MLEHDRELFYCRIIQLWACFYIIRAISHDPSTLYSNYETIAPMKDLCRPRKNESDRNCFIHSLKNFNLGQMQFIGRVDI